MKRAGVALSVSTSDLGDGRYKINRRSICGKDSFKVSGEAGGHGALRSMLWKKEALSPLVERMITRHPKGCMIVSIEAVEDAITPWVLFAVMRQMDPKNYADKRAKEKKSNQCPGPSPGRRYQNL